MIPDPLELTDILTAHTGDSVGRSPPNHNVSHSPVRTALPHLIDSSRSHNAPLVDVLKMLCSSRCPDESHEVPMHPRGHYLICYRYQPIRFHRVTVVIYVLGFFHRYTRDSVRSHSAPTDLEHSTPKYTFYEKGPSSSPTKCHGNPELARAKGTKRILWEILCDLHNVQQTATT